MKELEKKAESVKSLDANLDANMISMDYKEATNENDKEIQKIDCNSIGYW